jgi:hypothetical protein
VILLNLLKCSSNSFNNRNGFAMPLAIFIILFVTLIAGVMMNALNNEFKTRAATEDKIITKYLAEAGIEHGIAAISGIIEGQLANSYLDTDYLKSFDILFNTIGGYDQLHTIYLAGEQIGEYQYRAKSDASEQLSFTIIEIDQGEFRAVLNNSTCTITAEGKNATKTFSLEAEVEYHVNYTSKQIEQVKITKWTEFYD